MAVLRLSGGIVLLVVAQGLAGCSNSPSSTPSTPSPISQAHVPPLIPMSSVSGFVLDTGFRSIPGARIEVVDGPLAGESTIADGESRFTLLGPFDRTTKFRAIKEDHVTVTQTAPVYCTGDLCYGSLQFYLPVVAPSVNLSGDYTLTFVADATCSDVPDEVRTRTYGATIAWNQSPNIPANTSLEVTLSGASFLGNAKRFEIGVAGDYLGFSFGEGKSVVEQLPGNTYLSFSGSAAATVEPGASTISTAFEGSIEYCATKSPVGSIDYGCGKSPVTGQPIPGEVVAYALCESKNHRLILTRR